MDEYRLRFINDLTEYLRGYAESDNFTFAIRQSAPESLDDKQAEDMRRFLLETSDVFEDYFKRDESNVILDLFVSYGMNWPHHVGDNHLGRVIHNGEIEVLLRNVATLTEGAVGIKAWLVWLVLYLNYVQEGVFTVERLSLNKTFSISPHKKHLSRHLQALERGGLVRVNGGVVHIVPLEEVNWIQLVYLLPESRQEMYLKMMLRKIRYNITVFHLWDAYMDKLVSKMESANRDKRILSEQKIVLHAPVHIGPSPKHVSELASEFGEHPYTVILALVCSKVGATPTSLFDQLMLTSYDFALMGKGRETRLDKKTTWQAMVSPRSYRIREYLTSLDEAGVLTFREIEGDPLDLLKWCKHNGLEGEKAKRKMDVMEMPIRFLVLFNGVPLPESKGISRRLKGRVRVVTEGG